jgi:flavin reductase
MSDLAEPSPLCTPKDFRSAMRSVPGALAVITAQHQCDRNGMTATAVCSVSADPPQLLICVNSNASIRPLIATARHFAVNFLSLDHKDIAALFSQSKLDSCVRFATGTWSDLVTGAPVLEGATSVFDCRVVSEAQHGSHVVIVGEVVATRTSEASPLLYHSGDYVQAKSLG